MKFIVISPLKDEEKTVENLIDSILKQSVTPSKILLINDGSSDRTGEIIDRYANDYDHIIAIHNSSKKRSSGGHVVKVINQGLREISRHVPDWDILLKIDGDLSFDQKNYFEFILTKFENNPSLGIASGDVYHLSDKGEKIFDSHYKWKTWGATKFYRRECFDAMGGLKTFKGWDGIDDILARHYGFITQKFREQEIFHYYETQTREEEGGIFEGIKREVLGYRYRNYPFYWYILKSIKLLKKNPYLFRGIYFFAFAVYANLFVKHKLSRKEAKICRKFIWKRIRNDFNYVTK